MATVWMFPGQGAQRPGMGAELFDLFPTELALADEVVGHSIRELCLTDPHDQLRLTQFLQPALFVVNALTGMLYRRNHPEPDLVAGHSLGEYNALLVAGAFDFETGVRLVHRRGELMGRVQGGGMLAVVGPDVATRIPELMVQNGITDVDLANQNSAEQTVLAGPKATLATLAELITASGAGRCRPLKVSAAFHSRYMRPASAEFGEFLAGVRLADPQLPVIANVTARPYAPGELKPLLATQISSSVRWTDSLRHLLDRGVREAVELGPGTVLTRLWASAVNLHGADKSLSKTENQRVVTCHESDVVSFQG